MRLICLKITLLSQNFTLIPFLGLLEVRNQLEKNSIINPIGKPLHSLIAVRGWRVKNVLTNSGEISLRKHIAYAASACENHSYMFTSADMHCMTPPSITPPSVSCNA